MYNTPFSRRDLLALLKGTAALTAVSMIAPALLSGCKKNPSNPGDNQDAKTDEAFVPCPSESLNEKQMAIRKNLKYVDQTPIRTRTCDNCKLYTKTKTLCGGCSVVPGPIHPKGYCSSWYYRM